MTKDNHNDFENQGWDAMLQTLDREMPVKKKRRTLLWLFFFMGLTAALGGGYWYVHTKTSTKTVDKIVSKPIVDNNLTPSSDDFKNSPNLIPLSKNNKNDLDLIKNKETNKNNIVQHKNGNVQLNKNTIFAIEINKMKKNAQVQETLKVSPTLSNNKTFDNHSVDNNDLSLNENNKTIDTQIDQIKTNDLNVVENNKIVENKTNINSIALLKTIDIAPLSIEQDTNLKIEPQPFFSVIRCLTGVSKKLRIGITAGIHTEKGQKINGFQAGLMVYKPLTYHWSISTGLNFRQTQILSNNISYFKKEYSANSVSPSNLQSGTPISLDKLYYLELPLTIQYKIRKQFTFSTGIKPSYLVGQSVKSSGNTVYFVNNSFNSLDKQGLISQINTTTLGLKRYDVSLLGGFSYLPTKHIELGLRYDLGLFNIINHTNWSAYNRYVGLNAVYLF